MDQKTVSNTSNNVKYPAELIGVEFVVPVFNLPKFEDLESKLRPRRYTPMHFPIYYRDDAGGFQI